MTLPMEIFLRHCPITTETKAESASMHANITFLILEKVLLKSTTKLENQQQNV
jgi:hypothetical protein